MLRRPVVLSAALLVLLVASGCSSGTTSGGVAGTTTAPVETTTPAPTGARPWFIKDGRVAPATPRPLNPADPVRGALDALMAGPTPEEAAAGYSTGIAAGIVEVQSFEIGADGIVTVSFSRKFETADTRPQTAEVVYTLTELPQVTKVRFLIDGQPNGATGVPPVGRADLRFPTAE
ncbi:MAG: GerMN domain-containing protein [Acidimicrobiales bacterium]